MRGCGCSVAVAACLFLTLWIGAASAEEAPVVLFQGGGARDVAAAPGGDVFYVAVYGSNEVVAVGVADGVERARVKLAGGPSALEVVGNDLAVLGRSGAGLTLLNSSDLSTKRSISVSAGTSVIFSAGAGRVCAVNPVKSEIAVVDLAKGAIEKSVTLTDAIPVAGAFSGGRIGIAGHAPNVVCLLDANSLEILVRKELPGAPRAIAPIGDGRFVVEIEDELIVLDGSTLEPIRRIDLVASGLRATSQGIVCVAGGASRNFTADLESGEARGLPEGAVAARWAGSTLLAWSPTLGKVWRAGVGQIPAPVERRVATVEPALTRTPEPIAAAPRSEAAAPGPSVEVAKIEAAAPTSPEPSARTSPLEPTQVAEAPPASAVPALEPEVEPEDVPKAEYRFTIRPKRLLLGGFLPYAPRFGDPTGRTFEEELNHALDFSNDPDSLTNIDFEQPFENLVVHEGGNLRGNFRGPDAKTEYTGGVDFSVDEVHITADRLQKTTQPPELTIEGNVKLERGESNLTADKIRAFDALPPILPGVWPLVPARGRKAIAHPLVPRGYHEPKPRPTAPLGATEIDTVTWTEPERRLVADRLELNTLTRKTKFINANGEAGPLYFGAKSLELHGPRKILGQDLWVTTCDQPTPHYRLRLSRVDSEGGEKIVVTSARLQLGKRNTPLYVPRVSSSLEPDERRLGTVLHVGSASSLGSYIDVAQWYRVTPEFDLAPRLYVTARKGIGVGLDGKYDYMDDPTSPLYRSRGQFQTFYTTEQDGFTHWYHRQELTPNTVLLGQWEQWYNRDILKDFYRDVYENRTGPRSFMSVSHLEPGYMATATVAPSLNNFATETAKLPELTFHMFERQLGAGFYGTFDSAAGYYETRPETVAAARALTVGRVSYDMNLARGLNLLPFAEVEGTYYSDTLRSGNDAVRGTATVGVTVQGRLQRTFAGVGNFSGFKHLIIPSATLSFRPDATLDAADTPSFDALDRRPGRLRIESTLDNIVLAKNAPTGEVWPVTRLTLYQGTDLENQALRSNDYEMDLEVRPRPSWGLQAIAETHQVNQTPSLPGEDFSRLLTYVFYDDKLGKNRWNGRVGFAYTQSANDVLNQEILYGVGYRLTGKWSASFEQRYDFEQERLTRQSYFIRRKLHDWEVALGIRTRQSSVDVVVQINLVNFPEIGM